MQTTATDEHFNLEASAAKPSTEEPSNFRSILSRSTEGGGKADPKKEPDFFHDLNLDQIVDLIVAGREKYDLKPFFYTPMTTVPAIEYRQEVMRDLENEALLGSIKSFSSQMHTMRGHLMGAERCPDKYAKEAWFLEAIEIYRDGVKKLDQDLRDNPPKSSGLLAFRSYLSGYLDSGSFIALAREANRLRSGLAAIRYTLLIKGSSITVANYESEADYSAAVEEKFAKFGTGAVNEYLVKFADFPGMNHIEVAVLERVAQLNPAIFSALVDYCLRNGNFADPVVTTFDREVQFYIAWLEFVNGLKQAGLKFSYPQVSATCKNVSGRDSFDLALAAKLAAENSRIICNDFVLKGSERILVVSGPNQGGKTTFARTFGQLHYLAALGGPLPGVEARLFLCDQLFTHFEREEDITNLRGKLEDDLMRIHRILQLATPNSLIVINEIFSSTTLKDAVELSRNIIERVSELDALCVCVTFLDELSTVNEHTVSMVAEVEPDNPTLRTFKIRRKPADGLAYATAIAEKYQLTYRQLHERIKR